MAKSVAAFERSDQQIQEQRLSGGFLHGFDETVRICFDRHDKTEKTRMSCHLRLLNEKNVQSKTSASSDLEGE